MDLLDIANLQWDRVDAKGKTIDEINKHTLDPVLETNLTDRAVYLLTRGDDLQKLSVAENLPNLYSIDPNVTLTKVLPKIQQELLKSVSEFHITTSRSFRTVIQNNVSARDDKNFTGIIIQGLDSKDPIIANTWLETLLEVMDFLTKATVQEILSIAVSKGQCTQPTTSRIISSKLLGKITLHQNFKPLDIKKDILPTVYLLCQDINYTVRAAICEQMPAIAKGLGASLVKNTLLSSLVELCSDDNTNVKSIAISSIIQILPFVDKETKSSALVTLIMNLCSINQKLEEASGLVLAKNMGLLLTSLENCISSQNCERLVVFYMQLAKKGLDTKTLSVYNVDTSQDVKGREYCGINFPAVLTVTLNLCPNMLTQLYDIFKILSSDSCFIVRQAIAGVFHEVAHILDTNNAMMKNEFNRLLRDDADEVLGNLIPHLNQTLMLFLNSGTLSVERQDNVSNEVVKSLLKCLTHLMKGYNWRLTTTFIKELEVLPFIVKCDQINSEFTPQIARVALYGRHRPVRVQSTRTLLIFLRWNTKVMQRVWLKDHLIQELSQNKCCYTRYIFIELCKHAIEIFSNKYFKENFFEPLLKLTADEVSTIRFATVSLLPKLRKMLKLPQDRKLLSVFEQVILTLEKNEKDRDVLANLISKTKEMMVPSFITSINGEDIETRERRLIDEEEAVLRGKIPLNPQIFTQNKSFKSPTAPTTQAIISSGSTPHQSITSVKPVTVRGSPTTMGPIRPPTPSLSSLGPPVKRDYISVSSSPNTQRSQTITSGTTVRKDYISDMTILNQHFYIDAGINLPLKNNYESFKNDSSTRTTISLSLEQQSPPPPPLPSNIFIDTDISDSFSNLSFDSAISVDSMNITDDIKVNMRHKKIDKSKKRFSHSEIPTATFANIKNKRHSSVFTDTINNTKLPVLNKRRSLNMFPREFSRIPVSLKSVENLQNRTKIDDNNKNRKINASNLPVPVKKPTMTPYNR